jgi:hypothetical protein
MGMPTMALLIRAVVKVMSKFESLFIFGALPGGNNATD